MLKSRSGFTIVELLIVIVVIGILAAITIATYSGVQNKANDTAVQSDLRSSYSSLLQYQATEGSTPTDTTPSATLSTLFTTTRSAYITDTNAYLYCRNNSAITVIGRSKSGQGFYAGTNGSGKLSTWPGNGNIDLCPAVGIETNSPGYNFIWLYAGGNGSAWNWAAWVK